MNFKLMKSVDSYLGLPLCVLCAFLNRFFSLFSKKKIDITKPNKIIILKWFGIGTNIKLAPFYCGIRRKFPDAKILFFTFDSNKKLIELLNFADQIKTIRTDNLFYFFVDTLRHIFNFCFEKSDIVIDFEFLSKFSTFFSYLTGAVLKLGFCTPYFWRAGIINYGLSWDSKGSLWNMYKKMVKLIGVDIDMIYLKRLNISLSKQERLKNNSKVLGWNGEYLLGINVNASEILVLRRWPVDNFLYLIENITKHIEFNKWKIVLVGSSKEMIYTQSLFLKLSPLAQRYTINLCGKTDLEELIALMDNLKVFISCDSGPLYLAVMQDIPTISLWGPSSPYLHSVNIVDSEKHIFFYSRRKCSPCFYEAKPGVFCNYEAWCMKDIKPDEVLNSLVNFIYKNGTKK